jgi:hypothetical protein
MIYIFSIACWLILLRALLLALDAGWGVHLAILALALLVAEMKGL